jgi:hypothetical protein
MGHTALLRRVRHCLMLDYMDSHQTTQRGMALHHDRNEVSPLLGKAMHPEKNYHSNVEPCEEVECGGFPGNI